MSVVRSITDHRERKNAAILADWGASRATIMALTNKGPAVNYRVSNQDSSEYKVSKNLRASSKTTDSVEETKAAVFIKMFRNLDSVIGENYSKSERFISAYLTYKSCLNGLAPLNVNTCYRVIEDASNTYWYTETCRECSTEFIALEGALECCSCKQSKKISCSRCGGLNDRSDIEKRKGHPFTICSSCKTHERKAKAKSKT